MTATATQVSQRAAISDKEWVGIFPKNVIENYTSSVSFMKQLTLVAVSMITYAKNAFPEESYSTVTFGQSNLKLLKSRCSDDLAQFVSTSLQQAWEAFDKKYFYGHSLVIRIDYSDKMAKIKWAQKEFDSRPSSQYQRVHQLALCFYENECQPENLCEYHIFEYSYNADGVTLNINSNNRGKEAHSIKFSLDKLKQRTSMLIRMLYMYVSQNGQQELPLNYDVSVRLYYNDDAPEGYQAPGFCYNKGPDHIEPTITDAVRIGWVETPYHKMVAWSYVRAMFPDSDEAAPSANPPAMEQGDDADYHSRSSAVDPSPGSAEVQIRCSCNRRDVPTDPASCITCQYCHRQQHAVCFGFLPGCGAGRSRAHCCAACYDEDRTRTPSDPKLVEYDLKRRECLAVCRRTLDLCSKLTTISGQILVEKFGISDTSAAKVIRLLQTFNVVPQTADEDITTTRKINPIRLKLAFKRFFHDAVIEEDTMVDRLMAETAASQETTDPVGEVLSPLEKVALRNTSNLGQIIENPEERNKRTERLTNDKTLQQYREAVMMDDDITEELPLSGSHNPVKDVEKIGRKKSNKRKIEDDDWLPKVRSGAKTKKARAHTTSFI